MRFTLLPAQADFAAVQQAGEIDQADEEVFHLHAQVVQFRDAFLEPLGVALPSSLFLFQLDRG